ncbi:uncharacterized protein LOC135815201 [Sycon ciliatum]|uniref:uncharacterized protein LOC135815201 n=1 Tax=Sycon ciliatum TaxID=27933 RepID=UPI0031F66FDC
MPEGTADENELEVHLQHSTPGVRGDAEDVTTVVERSRVHAHFEGRNGTDFGKISSYITSTPKKDMQLTIRQAQVPCVARLKGSLEMASTSALDLETYFSSHAVGTVNIHERASGALDVEFSTWQYAYDVVSRQHCIGGHSLEFSLVIAGVDYPAEGDDADSFAYLPSAHSSQQLVIAMDKEYLVLLEKCESVRGLLKSVLEDAYAIFDCVDPASLQLRILATPGGKDILGWRGLVTTNIHRFLEQLDAVCLDLPVQVYQDVVSSNLLNGTLAEFSTDTIYFYDEEQLLLTIVGVKHSAGKAYLAIRQMISTFTGMPQDQAEISLKISPQVYCFFQNVCIAQILMEDFPSVTVRLLNTEELKESVLLAGTPSEIALASNAVSMLSGKILRTPLALDHLGISTLLVSTLGQGVLDEVVQREGFELDHCLYVDPCEENQPTAQVSLLGWNDATDELVQLKSQLECLYSAMCLSLEPCQMEATYSEEWKQVIAGMSDNSLVRIETGPATDCQITLYGLTEHFADVQRQIAAFMAKHAIHSVTMPVSPVDARFISKFLQARVQLIKVQYHLSHVNITDTCIELSGASFKLDIVRGVFRDLLSSIQSQEVPLTHPGLQQFFGNDHIINQLALIEDKHSVLVYLLDKVPRAVVLNTVDAAANSAAAAAATDDDDDADKRCVNPYEALSCTPTQPYEELSIQWREDEPVSVSAEVLQAWNDQNELDSLACPQSPVAESSITGDLITTNHVVCTVPGNSSLRIWLRQGDIMEDHANAVVVPTDECLTLALAENASDRLTQLSSIILAECSKLSITGPLPASTVLRIGGNDLADYLLLAVCSRHPQTDPQTLQATILNSLQEADKLGARTITLPTLVASAVHTSTDVYARALTRALMVFAPMARFVRRVQLIAADKFEFRDIASELPTSLNAICGHGTAAIEALDSARHEDLMRVLVYGERNTSRTAAVAKIESLVNENCSCQYVSFSVDCSGISHERVQIVECVGREHNVYVRYRHNEFTICGEHRQAAHVYHCLTEEFRSEIARTWWWQLHAGESPMPVRWSYKKPDTNSYEYMFEASVNVEIEEAYQHHLARFNEFHQSGSFPRLEVDFKTTDRCQQFHQVGRFHELQVDFHKMTLRMPYRSENADYLLSRMDFSTKAPSHWDVTVSQGLLLNLNKWSNEYVDAAGIFLTSAYHNHSLQRQALTKLPAGTPLQQVFPGGLGRNGRQLAVSCIQRVQNEALYRQYQAKKESMERNPSSNRKSNEQHLFHGTTSESVQSICAQGFNRSFAGKHGTAYGKGVYFTRYPSYAAGYSFDGQHKMILARVLVGDYHNGSGGLIAPNVRNGNTLELMDSTVDNEVNPSIFVTYHDAQMYPEFVITFQ